MDIKDLIKSSSFITIGFDSKSEEFVYSLLDDILKESHQVSFIDYRDQKFTKDDLILESEAQMRELRISSILNYNSDGYFIVNLKNFISNSTALNKAKEISDLIRFVSCQVYSWSSEDCKIRSIFISEIYSDISGLLTISHGRSAVYNSDSVIHVIDNNPKIVKSRFDYLVTDSKNNEMDKEIRDFNISDPDLNFETRSSE